MVVGRLRAHTDLLDLDLFLRLLGFFLFFRPLVCELPVIDYPANGRIGVWGHFYQIEVGFVSFVQRFFDGDNANILTVRIDQADFFDPDAFI